MKNGKAKRRFRSLLIWTLWVLLAQFILMNISAALYAHKLTHLQALPAEIQTKPGNIFEKTWRLFTGPVFYKQPLKDTPDFAFMTVQLKTAKGITIEAWYAKADSAAKGTVLLFHGLTSNKGQVLDEATVFRNWGYHVMLADMRSHGNSSGEVTTIGYYESEEIKLAYDYVVGRGEKNVILWGVSMGAVAIMKAIADHELHPSGIIVEIPFLSLQHHLEGRARILGFPGQPFGFLTTFWIGAERGFNGFGFRTTRYAKKIHCPVLEQCGEKDKIVLRNEAESIYQAIPSASKKLVMYDNALHESFLRKDPAVWKKEVEAFLVQIPGSTF